MARSCSDDLVPDMTRPAGLRVEVPARPEDLLQLALSYPDRYPVFLDSAGTGPLANRHLLFRSNGEILRRDAAGRVTGNHAGAQIGFLDALQAWFQKQGQSGLSQDWLGGWVVYLGYECAAEVDIDPERTHQPRTHKAAENTDDDVPDQPKPAALKNLAAKPSGYCANDKHNDE